MSCDRPEPAVSALATPAEADALRQALQALREGEARLRSLTQLSSDWYWEQDEHFRFVSRSGGKREHAALRPAEDHGKTRWELPVFGVTEAQWAEHRALLEARLPFRDFTYQRRDEAGRIRHVSVSGHPVFDEQGRFRGYRGISKDVTEARRAEQLLALEHAVARCLAEAETLDAALEGVIRAVCEAQHWEHGAYWRHDTAADAMCFAHAWHVPGEDLAHYTEGLRSVGFARGTGLVGLAWQSGEAVWVPDFGRDPRVLQKDLPREISLRGLFAFPVVADATIIGVLGFFSRLVAEPDERLLAAARVIGSQIGQFAQRKQREEALRESEARFRSLCALSSDWYWEQDEEFRFTQMSGGVMNKGDFRVGKALGRRRWELPVVPESTDWESHKATLRAHQPFTDFEYRIHTEDGGVRHYSVSGEPVFDEQGRVRGYRGVANDITRRKLAERTIRQHAMQQGLIAALGHKALAHGDLESLLREAASAAAEGLAVPFCAVLQLLDDGRLLMRAGVGWREDCVGRCVRLSDPLSDDGTVLAPAADPQTVDLVATHGVRSSACVEIRGAGQLYGLLGVYSDAECRFSPENTDYLRSLANTLATAIDRWHAEQALARLAQFDPLTGLPNRTLFLDRFGQALKAAARGGWSVGVLFVDIDRFKIINDTLGHSSGDKLLVQAAERLQHCVRAEDVVGRLGGDEFAFVLSHLTRPDDAALVAQKVVASLAAPFDLDGQEVYVSASVGIGIYPVDGADAGTLLRNADTAMYRAKESGRNGYQFYLPQMNEQALERLQLQTQLRGALERDELRLHYQPKVDLATGAISGFEALLRWQHPQRGLVPPLQFVPILEDIGLIVPVGEWVVRTVCEQLLHWQAAGIAPRPVAVNLSARQFQQRQLDASIAAILADTGVAPQLLELELTESVLMSDADEATRTLDALRSQGVRLAVDDFGTGYSSLAYLKRLPLDALKIDRAFVRDVTTDPDDAAITRAIISLAHSLNLKVVAEGVETAEQLQFLREHGCDEMQGYYFAKPMEAEAATRLLAQDTRLA
jgi:diguanylate cyclase (GGDEF)-like protein/PAS domain S-box-containing protein